MYLPNAITESEATYDQKFIQLFRNKKFLAPILKNIVKEYESLPLEEIEDLIISIKGSEAVALNIETEDADPQEEVQTYYRIWKSRDVTKRSNV